MTAQHASASVRWSCARKHRFTSYREADKVAARMRRRDDEPMVAYGCRFCGGWHVGHERTGTDR
jgi:hypothetical protein